MRRWTHSLLVAVVLAVTATTLPGSPAAAQVEPAPLGSSGPSSWHGGPLHDGHTPGSAIAPPLDAAWQVNLPRVSHAVTGRGRAFVLHASPTGAALRALDVATGATLWGPLPLGGPAEAGHAYDDGRVFSVSATGLLRAHDEVDGRELWSVKVGDWSATAPITAAFGSVYVAGGSSLGSLVALDAATGEHQWTRRVTGSGTGSAPVVTSDSVYLSAICGVAQAFRRTDGAPLWTRSTACSGAGGTTAGFHDGRLYVRDRSHPAVLDAQTGEVVGPVRAARAPALRDGVGYFVERGVLTARDLRRDEVLWSTPGEGGLATSAYAVGGHVYVGGAEHLYAFRESDGVQVWRSDVAVRMTDEDLSTSGHAGITVTDETMLVAGSAGLTALRPAGAAAPPALPRPPDPPAPDAPAPAQPDGPAPRTTEVRAWQGGPLHAGHTRGETFAPPLAQSWTATVPSASHALVAGGRAFVLGVHPTGSTGSDPARSGSALSALDVDTGARLWGPVSIGGDRHTAGHAYDRGRVFTVNDEGVVRAHDAATGAQLWEAPLQASMFGALLTADGGEVFVSVPGSDSRLKALDGATGELRWEVQTDYGYDTAPVVTPDAVFVTLPCGALAFRRSDGARRWEQSVDCLHGSMRTASLHGDRLYVRDGRRTLALETATGAVVAGYATKEAAAFSGDTGYFLEEGTLTARSLPTGRVLWRRASNGGLHTAPYLAAGHLYLGSRDALHAFRASDGVEVWRGPLRVDATNELNFGETYDGITIAHGRVFVSAGDSLTALHGVPTAPLSEPVVEPVPLPALPGLPLPSLPPLPSSPLPSSPLPVGTPAVPTSSPSASPSSGPGAGLPTPGASPSPSASPSASRSPSPSSSASPSPGQTAGPNDRPVPRARDTADACPPGEVPPAGFRDLPADGTHTPSVECLVWWEVARGRTSDTYGPALPVTRGQMATFVANAITASGGSLPSAPPNAFADDEGSVHERSIDRLAAVGIVAGRADGSYGPDAPVRRDAMAKFLVLAYEYRAQTRLSARAGYFSDDDGNTHEANIDKAAEAGFTGGSGDGSYRPAEVVRRDQMGSFLARVLDLSVEQTDARPPSRR